MNFYSVVSNPFKNNLPRKFYELMLQLRISSAAQFINAVLCIIGLLLFSSIYKFGLSVCLFVSNKRQNG